MRRLLLLLAAATPDGFENHMPRARSELERAARDIGTTLRMAVQIENDPMAAAAGDRTVVPLHGLVEFTADGDAGDALVDLAGTAARVLGDAVDWTASAACIGTVHEVLPSPPGDLLLVLAAHGLPSLDHAAFGDYWLHRHAALALSLLDDGAKARMGYQQVHAEDALSRRAATAAGASTSDYDGILEVRLAAIEHLPHATNPAFAQAIADDERNFTDQSAAMCGAFLRLI
jgi:EthD domain